MQTYVYTCPNCGNDLRLTMLTCNPPINKYECYKCGWSYEDKRDETIRIPFSKIKNNTVSYFNDTIITT